MVGGRQGRRWRTQIYKRHPDVNGNACEGMVRSPGWLECRMGKGEGKTMSQERQIEAQL